MKHFLFVLAAMFSLIGCNNRTEDEVTEQKDPFPIGTWKLSRLKGINARTGVIDDHSNIACHELTVLEFTKDNTFSFLRYLDIDGKCEEDWITAGTYTYDANTKTINYITTFDDVGSIKLENITDTTFQEVFIGNYYENDDVKDTITYYYTKVK